MGVLAFVFFIFMIKNVTIRGDEYAQLNQENNEKVNLFKSFGTFTADVKLFTGVDGKITVEVVGKE